MRTPSDQTGMNSARPFRVVSSAVSEFPLLFRSLPWWDISDESLARGGTLRFWGRSLVLGGIATESEILERGSLWSPFGARVELQGGSFGDVVEISIGQGSTLRIPPCKKATVSLLTDDTAQIVGEPGSTGYIAGYNSICNATWRPGMYPGDVRTPVYSVAVTSAAPYTRPSFPGRWIPVPPHATHLTVRPQIGGGYGAPTTLEFINEGAVQFQQAIAVGTRYLIPAAAQFVLMNGVAPYSAAFHFEIGDF